jgi:cytochrome b561
MIPAALRGPGALSALALGGLSLALCAGLILFVPERHAPPKPITGTGTGAQATAPAATAPETARQAPAARPGAAQGWIIDPAASAIGFSAVVDGAPFSGKFPQVQGTIAFDPDHLAQSRADISVAIAGVASGSSDRDASIVSADWFDAANFPQAHFVSDRFEKTGDNAYTVHGTLTLRDTSLPVEMPFTLVFGTDASGRRTADAKGSFGISRTQFRIGRGDWADTSEVADHVDVTVALHTVGE